MLRHDEERNDRPGRNPSSPCIEKQRKPGKARLSQRLSAQPPQEGGERRMSGCPMWFRMSFHIGRQGRVILHPLRIRRGVHLAYGIPELSMGRRRIAARIGANQPAILATDNLWHHFRRQVGTTPLAEKPFLPHDVLTGNMFSIPQMAHVHERYAGGRHLPHIGLHIQHPPGIGTPIVGHARHAFRSHAMKDDSTEPRTPHPAARVIPRASKNGNRVSYRKRDALRPCIPHRAPQVVL